MTEIPALPRRARRGAHVPGAGSALDTTRKATS